MARDSKLEVAAVNIRIPEDKDRDYASLIEFLSETKRGVRVYGETYVAISSFGKKDGIGIFSKYTEIDIDGDWFDIDDFDTATPEKLDGIDIPNNLKPNLSQFYFKLNEKLHILAFALYAESRGLSARSVEKYFKEALSWPSVVERFGRVQADVVKDYAAVDQILELSNLKELHLVIRRPNPDDVGKNLAEIIEERLREQNADEYEESLKSKANSGIDPNERTQKLAAIAAENGEVRAKSLVNGILTPHSTDEKPLVEARTYKKDDSERVVFVNLAERIFGRVQSAREQIDG